MKLLEYFPELGFATATDGIVTVVLFLICLNMREIRGRLLPLCILTLIHTLLFPLMIVCDSFHATYFAKNVLGCIHLFSTPVLLVFIIIYSIALANKSHMNRPLAISSGIFFINLIVQGLCAFLARGRSLGG